MRGTRLLAWLFAAVLFAFGSTAHAKTVAVVVGNNVPPEGAAGEGLATLRYADDDAHRYAELFRRFVDQTVLLTVYDAQTRGRVGGASVDGPPTRDALRKALGALNWDEDLTAVYIVFTGHGAIDASGAPFLSLLDGPLTRTFLFDELLRTLPAERVHLIIDACHAAGVVGLRGDRFGTAVDGSTTPVTPEDDRRWAQENTLARFPHVGVLASSSTGESSHEWSVLEAGVFSHELLSGMWGAADINADQRIEYSELQSFVASANRGVQDPRAKPSVVVHPPALDPHVPLVELGSLRETALLEGDLSSLGHFHVELGDGRRHLDGNVGGPIAVAVPAGRVFLRASQTEYAFEARAGQRIAFADLAGQPREASARGSTADTFRRRLFAEPYTYDYYRGFVDSVGAVPVALPQPPSPADALVTTPPVTRREDDDVGPRSRPRSRAPGLALLSVAGVSGAVAIGTGVRAAVLRSRFSNVATEREAEPLVEPHRRSATVAVSMAVTSGVTAVAGLLLLRRAKTAR
ncbi:MAG: caspase family protein [Myxococcota bacterium]